jgi:hypothetical protein
MLKLLGILQIPCLTIRPLAHVDLNSGGFSSGELKPSPVAGCCRTAIADASNLGTAFAALSMAELKQHTQKQEDGCGYAPESQARNTVIRSEHRAPAGTYRPSWTTSRLWYALEAMARPSIRVSLA